MHAAYGDRKVWDREVWPPEDYDAIYKIAQSPTMLSPNPPLCSTFLHSNPIQKMSVRIIFHTKPPNHLFKSLPSPICDGI